MSNIRLSPYVNFQGHAREAMEFYQRVLGGTLDLYTIDAQGAAKPAAPGERITHARLEADGALILASDGHPDYPAAVGENIALAVSGADKARLSSIFNKLADGGKTKMPLTAQPWGADVGWLTDKFGMNWMVTVEKA